MAEIKVNPTRMELKKLKSRLSVARRGHKLLKDKRDELMRQFLEVVKQAKELRRKVAEAFRAYNTGFESASALTDKKMMQEALMLPRTEGELKISYRNIMSVTVPEFHFDASSENGANYGYAFTTGELDDALSKLSSMLGDMVRLAELEKTSLLLCDEIEKTRRRVNALEYIMIPQYERAIKVIAMKLEENERGNRTRLMKVKDMMIKAQLEALKGVPEDE
ncbi:MAG: V-type ATP synthase subunit D [Clostridia bacterium]|nr:V-type ATP synthase subunit D [Clostridia bacterium]